ncbi:MAG: GAF domain-containing protein, partial [Flammeovirgaceae bacterium]|nr:GAF domain-containing protein [Flammeovirgaceae bacterium]MDW8287456.1 GAF domain-containing protein [Flammeovirgaceae bacterium]
LYLESHHASHDLFSGGAEFIEVLSPYLNSCLFNILLLESFKKGSNNNGVQIIEKVVEKEIVKEVVKEVPKIVEKIVEVPTISTLAETTDDGQAIPPHILKKFEEEKRRIYEDVKLMGKIGQDITSLLSVEKIIEAAYENINSLMDASVFDIGIYNKKYERIEFPGSIEKGQRLPFNYYELSDDTRLAVWCFKNCKEVFINDISKEFNLYLPNVTRPAPVAGESCQSIIYLPILTKGKPIGVLTVQSFNTNAYTEYHLNIMRNLAIYVAIALENAFLYETQKRKAKEHAEEIMRHEKEIERKNKVLEEQKDEIEQAYQNVKLLGEIGQDITANLSVDKIIETVYESVNTLMDAPLFSIGIYNEKAGCIDFPAAIANDKKIPAHSYHLDDDTKLAVYCFKNLREIFINDFQREFNQFIPNTPIPKPEYGELPESVLYLPLIGKSGPVGVITVQSFQKNAYSEYDMNILRNLAIYAGIALDNALLYENLEEKVRERTQEVTKQKEEIEKSYHTVRQLSEIGLDITSSLSTEEIMKKVYHHVNNLMDATAFGIGIVDPIRHRIEFRGALERGEELPMFYHSLNDEACFSTWCYKNKKEIFINDYRREYKKYVPDMRIGETGEEPQSIIYLPIFVKENVIGVITVQSFEKNAYTENHLNILKNLAVYIGIAIENSKSYAKIERQKEEIEKTSQKVTSSIKYAKRIQNAILPNRTLIKEILPDSFVFFKPRDIVSGDFFWFAHKPHKQKLFVAAVDCTGHGVPGAFMSMIGNDLLNEAVNLLDIDSPDEILTAMHNSVRKLLKQDESENRDGMDLAICMIDKNRNVLEYAGAKNPLIYVRKGELFHIKGDKFPVGGHALGEEEGGKRIFTKHTIPLDEPDTTFYIFSDGYQDQFGGGDGRKFMIKNLKAIFQEVYNQPMELQRKKLLNTLRDWMADEPMQTDDILVIGFRVSNAPAEESKEERRARRLRSMEE